MTRDEYNAKVQEMQRFCIACGMEHRIKPFYDDKGAITSARFQVFYGDWRMLGWQERPFQPDSTHHFLDGEATKVQAEVARDVAR